jgi:cell division protein FtsQ
MQQRKSAKRRKKRQPRQWSLSLPNAQQLKKLSIVLLPLLLVGLILAGIQWMKDPKHLPISQVEITGDLKYIGREKMAPVIEPYTKTNLYLLDANALEEELEFEPWIRSVGITKAWPNRLVIDVTEQRPLAFWGDDRMVNNHGEIFDATADEMRGVIPVLYHPEEQGLETISNYKKVQSWLSRIPAVGVAEFMEDARGAWQLKLTNGLIVDVGRDEQEKRLHRFVVGYLKGLTKKVKKIRRVDLRYTNGFAVEWKRR